MLDWKYFPHIFDHIYDYLDADGMNVLRLTCTTLRHRVEIDLWEHITVSHGIMMCTTSDHHSRTEALVYTRPQTYSTRYGCPLPRAYQDGHPQITKTVNVVHHPGRAGKGGISHCEDDRPEDHEWCCDSACPTADILECISTAIGARVAVQLLYPNTYRCSDLSFTCHFGGFHSCITAFPLKALINSGPDYMIDVAAPQHIFKLAYPPRGLATAGTVDFIKELIFKIHHIIVLLYPESSDDCGNESACYHPSGVKPFVEGIVPCATESFVNKVTCVAIESWPPDAPRGPRLLTPHTTSKAFRVALKASKESYRATQPDKVIFFNNINVISWEQLREQVGETTCSLLAKDIPPAM
ncbi:hypothetical protein A1Q2_05182 [Trichosporon asahii var. asahii CBS 8904]|uniref:F-box domain-containing protein n=2 Tax=Trichosporon asahii var. asahii TaxID=189963 RepID=K1VMB9_TRIAC|nr:hypothetical protein A1Q1_06484 [Trichosporon asahii var. asahii CBS 2479]EJT45167.1 hypothetical protein A1Q1_06484 [Trichosporon asahii var. asahii CBS 2479]EKD00517.1 hypothetical protein A1Q2_05182 [Trichosporon asahii var. asahii CBS 8904]